MPPNSCRDMLIFKHISTMKKLIPLIAMAVIHVGCFSQPPQQQKLDSVVLLVKQYFNAKDVDGLYNLTGEDFKKQLPPATFKQVAENNLFPLGEMKDALYEKQVNGVSKYKAVFATANLNMLISLDDKDKIKAFLFQPYTDDNARKTTTPPFTNPLQTALDKQVDYLLKPFIMQRNTVGVSIGVLVNDKRYFYNYGEAEKGSGTAPKQSTIYEIGSISKTFTATLLADAVSRGKIKLEDPVNKYLPDSVPAIAYNGTPVTVLSMINHSSGIPRMPGNFDFDAALNDPYKDYDDKKLFSFYKTFSPTRKAGDDYEYSNLAVGTVGVILEKVNNTQYENLLFKTICEPLAMHDTREYLRPQDSARFAKGYDNGQYAAPWNFKAFMGAGGIRSTAEDMLLYAEAQLGKAPAQLNKAIQITHTPTFTKGNTTVAMGWHIIKPGNDKLLFHNGGTGGYRSYLAVNPQKKFAVVMLSNTTISVDELGNNLMKWLEGQ